MRYLFPVLLVLCPFINGNAQTVQEKLDSLTSALSGITEDSNKVLLLCDISAIYYNIELDSSIAYGRRALNLANDIAFTRGEAVANKAIGRCYALKGNHAEALQYLNTALDRAREIKDHNIEGAVLTSLGSIYTRRGDMVSDPGKDFNKAMEYYQQATNAYELVGKSTSQVLHSIGNLLLDMTEINGMTEQEQMEKVEQALTVFRKAIKQEEAKEEPTSLLAKLHGTVGNVHCMLGNYPEGLKELNYALEVQLKKGNEKSASFTLNNIGYTYYQAALSNCKNCPDSIRNKNIALPKVLKYMRQSQEIAERFQNKRLLEHVYKNIADVYEDMGNYKLSKEYYVKHVAIGDTLRSFSEEKKFAKVEAEYAVKKKTDSLKFANTIKDKEISKRKTERNGTIAVLALVGFSGILLVNRQNIKRKKLKAEKELVDTNLALADSKLKKAQDRLNDFTKNLREKNQLIENFSAEIERLQALPCSNELPDTRENLVKLQNSIILTEEQWDDFKDTFEEVHSGFLNRMREKMPDLTPAETRFMALTKLRLTNKEMAGMLGVGDAAVRNYKYRLLKKLDLPADRDINEVVDSI